MPYKDKEKEREWRRQWWATLSLERKQEKQNKANERAKKIKVFLAEYKMSVGCKDCGCKEHHSALEFDHINGGKQINICFAKSIKQAKEEMKKCEVVCANCHRIRTYKRLYPCNPDIFELTYEPKEKLMANNEQRQEELESGIYENLKNLCIESYSRSKDKEFWKSYEPLSKGCLGKILALIKKTG